MMEEFTPIAPFFIFDLVHNAPVQGICVDDHYMQQSVLSCKGHREDGVHYDHDVSRTELSNNNSRI